MYSPVCRSRSINDSRAGRIETRLSRDNSQGKNVAAEGGTITTVNWSAGLNSSGTIVATAPPAGAAVDSLCAGTGGIVGVGPGPGGSVPLANKPIMMATTAPTADIPITVGLNLRPIVWVCGCDVCDSEMRVGSKTCAGSQFGKVVGADCGSGSDTAADSLSSSTGIASTGDYSAASDSSGSGRISTTGSWSRMGSWSRGSSSSSATSWS